MSTPEDDGSDLSRVRRSLAELRASLRAMATSGSVEQAQAALVDVVDGLLTHVERQSRALQDVRSDLGREQVIVTRKGGGAFVAPGPGQRLREFAASSNGDRWSLGRDEANGTAHVVHQANAPSGGAVTRIELRAFLDRSPATPEALELLRLIGRLVD